MKSKTVKVKNVKVSAGVKSKIKAIAKAIKETVFEAVKQGFRVWKRLDKSGYEMQGYGTVCNLRDLQIRKVDTQGKGQACILHKGEHGYGFTIGKLIGKDTIHAGFVQVRFNAKQIVAVFNSYADLVKYVSKHGELNVSGTEKWRTLSTGARYSLYSNGKQAVRFESAGSAGGNYRDYQKSGKYYGKFQSVKA